MSDAIDLVLVAIGVHRSLLEIASLLKSDSMRFHRSSARTSPLQVAVAVVGLVLCLMALAHFHGRGAAVAASSTPAAAASDAPVKSDVRVVRPQG